MAFRDILAAAGRGANRTKSALRQGDLFGWLSGLAPEEVNLEAIRRMPDAPLKEDPYRTNAAAHALTTGRIGKRTGSPDLAQIVGALQEVPSGIANVGKGQPFFTFKGEEGFSMPDLVANTIGVEQAKGMPSSSMLAPLIMAIAKGATRYGNLDPEERRTMEGLIGLRDRLWRK